MDETLQMIESCWIGTELARKLGLNSRFFSRNRKNPPKSLHKEVQVHNAGGLTLVRVPAIVGEKLRAGYTCHIVTDDTRYDYIFKLTDSTSIGFWK